MIKLFTIFTIIILFTPNVLANDDVCYYKQYSPLSGGFVNVPCEEPSKYRKQKVRGPVFDQYGRPLGTRVKGAKLIAYDKEGHRVGYYRRVGNKVLKYDRSGRMIATYSPNDFR